MSREVDQRIVQMQFDNRDFERNIATTSTSLKNFKKDLDFGAVSDGLEAITVKFSKWGSFVDQIVRNLANGFTNLIGQATSFAKSLSLDQISAGMTKYGQKTEAVGTIMAATGKDIDEVNEVLKKLNDYSDATSYSFTDMTSNIAKFTSAGVDLEIAENAMEGIASWAAKSGVNASGASRAMYNISQALGSGAMKSLDWRSIELLNMNTNEFKQTVLETAEAEGYLRREGDKLFDNTGVEVNLNNFRDTLSSGWFSTQVMVKTFQKYADTTTKFGKAAFNAAYEAKTFTDAVEAAKDAVSTGWMQSFEYVFGNYKEAKKWWTEVADMMIELFTRGTEARNELLKGWHDNKGMKSLQKSFKNIYNAITAILDIGSDAIARFFPKITVQRLVEITKNFEKFTKKLKPTGERAEKLQNILQGVVGIFFGLKQVIRNIIEAFKSVNKEFGGLGGDIVDFFDKVSTKIQKFVTSRAFFDFLYEMSDRIANVLRAFFKFYDGLKEVFSGISYLSEKGVSGVSKFIQGFGGVLKKLTQFVVNVFGAVTGKDVSKANEKISEFFNNFIIKAEKAKNAIKNFFQKVKDFFAPVANFFKDTWAKVTEKFAADEEDGGEKKGGLFERIAKRLEPLKKVGEFIKETFQKIMDSVGPKIDQFKEWIIEKFGKKEGEDNGSAFESLKEKLEPVKEFLQNVWKVISAIWEKVKPVLVEIWNWATEKLGELADRIKNADFTLPKGLGGTLFAFLGLFAGGNIIKGIKNFNKVGEGIADGVENFNQNGILGVLGGGRIASLLDGVKDTLSTFQNSLKANVLKKIAISIAILAASMIALSLVPSEKILPTLGGITGLLADLMASMWAVTKLSGKADKSGMKSISTALLILSASILVISLAVAKLAKLDSGKLWQGVGAIAALMTVMTATTKILQSDSKNMAGMAAGMIAYALAIRMMVKPVKKLGELPMETVIQGVGAISVLMLAMSASVKIMSGSKNMFTAAIAIGVMATSIMLLVKPVEQLGSMSIKDLAKGLGSVMLILATMAIVLQSLSGQKGLLKAGAAIVLVSGALNLIALALNQLKDIPLKNMAVSVGALVVVLAAMAAAANAMKKAGKGAAGIALISVALLALVPVVMAFASLKIEQVGIAILTLAGVLGVLVAAAYLVKPVIGPLIAIAGALALIGVAVLAVGGGILLAGTGMVAFAKALALLTVLGTPAINLLLYFIDSIITRLPMIAVKLAEAIVQFGVTLTEHIPEIVQTISAMILAVLQALNENIPQIAETILNLIINVLDKLVENLPTILEKLFTIVLQVLEKLTEYVPQFVDEILELFTGILDALIENVPTIVGKLIELLTKTLEEIASRVGDFIGSVVDLINATILGFTGKIGDIMQTLVQAVIDTINGLADTIRNKALDFYEAIKNLVSAIFEAIATVATAMINDMKDLGKKVMESGFIQGIRDKFQKIRTTVREFIDNAKKVIKEKIDQWKQVGKDLIEGLIKGVKEKFEAVKEAALNVVHGAVNAVKNFLGIESPSKVFAEIGRYSDEGLAVGLRKYSDVVSSATEDVGDEAITGLQAAMKDINDYINSDMDMVPIITPVVDLSNAQYGVSQLNRLMSGNSFSVRGVADVHSASDNYNNQLLNKIDQLGSNSGFGGTINVYVSGAEGQDVNEIADAVINRINHEIVRGKAAYA